MNTPQTNSEPFAAAPCYAFERWVSPPALKRGRLSMLHGMHPGEIRTTRKPRWCVYHIIRRWIGSNPEQQFSWATEGQITAVRRDA